jgi:hypothetical protein
MEHVEHYLYVVVNTDLESMNPGKAQAHSGHAASKFAFEHYSDAIDGIQPFARYFGICGFGTQINLKAKNSFSIDTEGLIDDMYIRHMGIVEDPTYPYVVSAEIFSLIPHTTHTSVPKYDSDRKVYFCTRNEVTAYYFFLPAEDDVKDIIRKRFDLHP